MAKKVAVINDLSGFGRCSLTAAIPVLSVMGIQPCPLPTAILSAQTGYSEYFFDDYTNHMEMFRDYWKRMGASFDGIYTGFVAGEEQIRNIFYFLDTFYKEDTFLLVDPIMGDDGEVYDLFTNRLCHLMKELVLKADIITPNLTELCLLTDADHKKLDRIREKDRLIEEVRKLAGVLQKDGPKTVIVTGLHYMEHGTLMMGNLAMDDQNISLSGTTKIGGSYSGTGDLFASVIAGGIARGDLLPDILKNAADFLNASIGSSPSTETYDPDGVEFERHLGMLM